MKKVFKMENLDCANCAAKMEDLIRKIEGVNDVNISFMTQKLTIDAEDEKFEEALSLAQKACSKVERSCKILA